MKRQAIASLILAGMLLCGCGDSSSTDSSTSSSQAESSSSAAESSSSTESSSSAADSSSYASPKYDYVHGSDGYYNIAEELKNFSMPMQQAGTCWLHAARASMQTSYEKQTGKELKMDIFEMLDTVYGNDKQEGYFIKEGTNKAEIGGWQWIVTGTLSRGYKDGITLDSSVIIDPTDREAIKNAITTRGGIAAEVCDENVQKEMFGNYKTVNYTENDKYDHDVTLIGWDDHFPKDYFKLPATQDGAWIAYNSNLGGVYYYISYCSPLGYSISHTVSDKYSEVLSYDAGNEQDRFVKTEGSTKTANVFHKKGKLAAVGTYNGFDKQDIKIEIMSADFKNVLHTQDAVLDYHGYHTVELTKPVDAEDFAVVITYSKGAPVEGETIENDSGMYKTVSEKGQSFVFTGGKWKDMTDKDIKTALKTYNGPSASANQNGAVKDNLSEEDINKLLNADFVPNNCCIKALFQK